MILSHGVPVSSSCSNSFINNIFKVDSTEYTFSTWFAYYISRKDIRNILLIAKSEEKIAIKIKEEYLYRGWHTDIEGVKNYYRKK